MVLKELENLAEESFKEFKTTEFICNYLKNIGVKNFKNTNPGVFGTISADKDKTVAIRADIDALPVDEERQNFKHMCGHHSHTAILLEFLNIANQNIDRLNFNLRFIFQPAEEIGKGAQFMIENGALDGVDEIYALHVEPNLNLGEIGLKRGVLLAGAKFFDITFKGKSTHAALPHQGNDVITASADFILKAQIIVSRMKDPVKSGVISFGKIEGGRAHNIIPDEVKISGTYRFFDFEIDEIIEKNLKSLLLSISKFYNIDHNIRISASTIPLVNDNAIIDKLIDKIKNRNFKIITDLEPMMGSEDFAFYLQKVPGVFIRLGIKKGEYHPPLHNINFYVPEEAVNYGVNLWKNIFLKEV